MPKTVFIVLFIYLSYPLFAFSTESDHYNGTFIPSQGPRKAPITIVQFSDFQCPSCAKAAPLVKQIFETYSGQVKWIFKNYPLRFHKDAALAHEAALAAGEQGKFWEMHDLIFANQTKMKRKHLLGYARNLNLNIDQFILSLDSGRYKEAVERDIEEGNTLGVRGSPTFIINGKKFEGLRSFVAFKSAIDKALVIASSIEIGPGMKPIPLEQVAVNIAKSPVRGPTDAPITIIEFSDFQSPLCAKSAKVIVNVMEKYHGKVKWLYKYYPQDITSVHEAACAAEEQGKFWEMHDLIFGRQEAIDALDHILYATQLGMDMDCFMTDLNSRRHLARIQQDRIVGKLMGVRGIPTFFINGKKLEGVRSFTAFESIIEEELGRLSQTRVALEDARKHSRRMTMVGPTDAPVQIMVFSDFQSLQSAHTAGLLRSLLMAYPEQILLQFKHYPLELHPEARLAHEAALAAGKQGKFWEMHDLIFSNSRKLGKEQLVKYAKMLELDLEHFEDALGERAYQALVQKDIIHGKQLGVSGVPTLFINGTRVDGASSRVRLKTLIEAELRQEMLCQE